ncbi:hypothetical protein [Desulfatitalea alkaliphila]|uniref:Uncharacterized protein n=1 Tax=Desulfatitalea alkaliphila TaxID=2929485 RepID=A0AA41R1J3_9BACT|nr:hypothetical protein [Desulfatitalea alkaliphila]MCJ8501197.1 hypothetical protein [Desulfatitalea alkaliphila]
MHALRMIKGPSLTHHHWSPADQKAGLPVDKDKNNGNYMHIPVNAFASPFDVGG